MDAVAPHLFLMYLWSLAISLHHIPSVCTSLYPFSSLPPPDLLPEFWCWAHSLPFNHVFCPSLPKCSLHKTKQNPMTQSQCKMLRNFRHVTKHYKNWRSEVWWDALATWWRVRNMPGQRSHSLRFAGFGAAGLEERTCLYLLSISGSRRDWNVLVPSMSAGPPWCGLPLHPSNSHFISKWQETKVQYEIPPWSLL